MQNDETTCLPATARVPSLFVFASWRPYGRFAVWLAFAVVAILCRPHGHPAGKASPRDESSRKQVRVITRCDSGVTHFLVENRELTEVTVTFNFDLTNLKGTVEFPYTATFPPRQTTTAFRLAPVEPGKPSHYSFTNHYLLGSNSAVHDDFYRYNLPYAPGRAFRVTQAYGGIFSHQGSNRYAIDWRMPVGTPIYAARGGVVVKVRDGSGRGGAHVRFNCDNNYVLVRHDDGTLGHYCHLKQGGAQVREGDVIDEGELVALSGNTGFSSGPHLHFAVYKCRNGKERESIPVKFRTTEAAALTLKTGGRYTAASPLPERVSNGSGKEQRVNSRL